MNDDERRTTSDERRATSDHPRRRSLVLRPSSLVIGPLAILALAIFLPAIGRAQEQPNRAGLVIQHGDGRVITSCVSFTEPEISGADLLDRAGVSYVAQKATIGAAVCKLDGEGCDYPTEDCFCHCKGADCAYWAYQHLRDGRWVYSQLSASGTKLRPGDVDGWAWGAGNVQAGAQPPVISFQEVCATTNDRQPTTGGPSPVPATPIDARQLTAVPPPTPTTGRRPTTALPPPTEPSATFAPPTTVPTTQALRASATPRPTNGHTPTTLQPATAALPPTENLPATAGAAGGAIPTQPAPPGANGASAASYLAFGALALLLVGGIVGALLRRSGRPS
ncbi:MAG TPA: hypothetical protein VGJ87_09605 [Roseiflexaceae bacterium]|jgi:hypothetical protein